MQIANINYSEYEEENAAHKPYRCFIYLFIIDL